MEEQKVIDPDIELRERKRTFIERAIGFVSGLAGGSVAGYYSMRQSIFNSIRDGLLRPDLKMFHANDYVKPSPGSAEARIEEEIEARGERVPGKYYGRINEVFTKDAQEEWCAREVLKPGFMSKLDETCAPDNALKAAYNDICNPEKNNKVFLDAKAAMEERVNGLLKSYNERVARIEIDYVGAPEKLKAEIMKANERFRKFFYMDYRKYFQKPIFNEMWKTGNKDAHMGLGLRQVDGKLQPFVFGGVTSVAVGIVAYNVAKWFLHRNDDKKASSHQQQIKDQRELSAATEPLGAVMH